jgi:hypothetical protein
MDVMTPEKRIFLVEDRVVLVRELEHPTPETISQAAQYIHKLSDKWDYFSIIVEFPGLVLPSAAVRHRVAEEMMPFKPKLTHVAVITTTNIVLNVAIRFIGAFSGFESISVHPTREAALAAIEARMKSIHRQ